MSKKYDVDQLDYFGIMLAPDAKLVGKYKFPQLSAQQLIPSDNPLPINYMTSKKYIGNWFHCFTNEKPYQKFWYNFNRYIPYIQSAKGLIATDFSLYRNDETDTLIRNCYKNRVMAYAMQKINPNVIPTAGFAGEKTWDWCFDGLPHHSTVAITTNGTLSDPEAKRLFVGGVDTLVKTLSPFALVICGKFPDWIYRKYPNVKIIPIPSYSQIWRRRCG